MMTSPTRQLARLLAGILLLPTGPLAAQGGPDAKAANPVRTLRVMIAGTRPMPAFEVRGDKVVEVEPPLEKIPPTSISFADPSHAPRPKPGKPARTDFSAWANEIVKIEKYRGPAILRLRTNRPLIEPEGTGREVSCKLGEMLEPLVFIHASPGAAGWNKPVARVIDLSPARLSARAAVAFNLSRLPINVYFSKKPVVVAPGKIKAIPLPQAKDNLYRYRIDTAVDGKLVHVSDSSYRPRKRCRLLVLAYPSPGKVKSNPLVVQFISCPL